jgi:Pvc16 N-terminal domain
MANHRAIYAVGSSLASFLQNSFPADLRASHPCQFKLVSSGEMSGSDEQTFDKMVSIYLHRITVNEHYRNATKPQEPGGKKPVIGLDLHYLLTYWGRSAEDEQLVMAWTMRQLQMNSILDKSILSNSADWAADETIQLTASNLSLEDIMRVWDALAPKYRLSIAYTARTVRLETDSEAAGPVVTTRMIYESEAANSHA